MNGRSAEEQGQNGSLPQDGGNLPRPSGGADQRLTRRPEEVGRILGVGRNGVYELIRTRQLRSITVGRKILVPLAAIDEFLAGRAS